ncbi:glycosyl transferase family 2 [Paenibacillus swuensis]|uniref:Glycosyl transferase family 2 n=1 Tax=Paenibacillus swuensis TaxID=1178515 RepID=A0A172TGD6_9BACL|nr:glycosyltransferase [Paenibacillus swuensis]ANE46101.1 glycosyl transferase family 2 [Paenibacillus swuensis]
MHHRHKAVRKSNRQRRSFTFVNSLSPKVSVIIPVMNEIKTISRIITQAARVHPETEIIVVANGSKDGTRELAVRMGAKVISFDEPLGHDVGRGVGAQAARGDILLFIDGDIVIPAKDLIPLVRAVEQGVDVALNQYLGYTKRKIVHPVVLAKHAMSAALNRPDLKGASLTTIPHALSRRALESIGCENLAVPPLALSMAIHNGLYVSAVHRIDVGRKNPRRRKAFAVDPLQHLIMGDHLEAIHWYIRMTDPRGNRPDLNRQRTVGR